MEIDKSVDPYWKTFRWPIIKCKTCGWYGFYKKIKDRDLIICIACEQLYEAKKEE